MWKHYIFHFFCIHCLIYKLKGQIRTAPTLKHFNNVFFYSRFYFIALLLCISELMKSFRDWSGTFEKPWLGQNVKNDLAYRQKEMCHFKAFSFFWREVQTVKWSLGRSILTASCGSKKKVAAHLFESISLYKCAHCWEH